MLLRPAICVKYLLSLPQKNCHQRKLRKTKCFLFNFWMIKLKSKHLVSLVTGFFEGMRENILNIFRALGFKGYYSLKSTKHLWKMLNKYSWKIEVPIIWICMGPEPKLAATNPSQDKRQGIQIIGHLWQLVRTTVAHWQILWVLHQYSKCLAVAGY